MIHARKMFWQMRSIYFDLDSCDELRSSSSSSLNKPPSTFRV